MIDPLAACACGTCASCSGPSGPPPVADERLYRHSAIKARMFNRIASTLIGSDRPLGALATRDVSDPALALIDAFAGALHILAFGAARLAEDRSITKTQDRDSLVRLARMLGYEPRPALSAATLLSFKVDAQPGSERIVIPQGTRIASVPGQNELPQSFETSEALEARPEWNVLLPFVPTRRLRVRDNTRMLRIHGTATSARVGDLVLAPLSEQPTSGSAWLSGRISAVERVFEHADPPSAEARLFRDRKPPSFTRLRLTSTHVLTAPEIADPADGEIILLGQRAAAFGASAPNLDLLPAGQPVPKDPSTNDWAGLQMLVPDPSHLARVERKTLLVLNAAGTFPTDSGETLKKVAEAFRRDGGVEIRVVGHSDGQGSAAANLAHSERLASGIRDALVAFDVRASAIQVEGKGDSEPLAGQNSRVEVVLALEVVDGEIDLDAVYPDAMPGRMVLFESNRHEKDRQAGMIRRVAEGNRTQFGLSGKVSRVWLKGIDFDNATGFNLRVRKTSIFIETAREWMLEAEYQRVLPDEPADRLKLLGAADLLQGRRLALKGEPCGSKAGREEGEEVKVAAVQDLGGGISLVRFERPIVQRFRAQSLVLLGNSVEATHGETVGPLPEVLGSTDARQIAPRYQLKSSPLSYVPAVNERGYRPALAVTVAGRLYDETQSLWDAQDDERLYTVKTVEEGVSEVQFAGRLPTGLGTIVAAYRKGAGSLGNLAAGRLTTIMTPVPGIASVANAVPAEGGSGAELLHELRTSAPQSIRTLDRVVSLADFEVFARRFRGVGKALASEVQLGMRKVVVLTIATTGLEAPVAGSSLTATLVEALRKVSVPGRAFRVQGFLDLGARLKIAISSDPDFERRALETRARTLLAERFGRNERSFGQPLARSEILAAVHDVKGVASARILEFGLIGEEEVTSERILSPAPAANGQIVGLAGLLWLDTDALEIVGMAK